MIGIIGTGFPSTTDFLNLLVLAVFARTAKKNDKLTNQDIGILIQKILDKDVYDECNLDVHSQDVTVTGTPLFRVTQSLTHRAVQRAEARKGRGTIQEAAQRAEMLPSPLEFF
jgi:hypothetical protein